MKKRQFVLFTFLTVLLGMIAIWIVEIISGKLPLVDQWTRALVDQFPDTYVYTFFRNVTNLGSDFFMYPFTIIMALVLFILFRDWVPAVIFGLSVYATHQMNKLIKFLVARDRPTISEAANAVGESLPSGHAMVSMVCYGLIAYFLVKKLKNQSIILFVQIFFALLVFLIGISRYVINVHYLTDVIAGFVFGFICLVIIIYLYEWIQKIRSQS